MQGLDFSVTTKIIAEIVIPELGLVQKSPVVNTTPVVTEQHTMEIMATKTSKGYILVQCEGNYVLSQERSRIRYI